MFEIWVISGTDETDHGKVGVELYKCYRIMLGFLAFASFIRICSQQLSVKGDVNISFGFPPNIPLLCLFTQPQVSEHEMKELKVNEEGNVEMTEAEKSARPGPPVSEL